MNYDVLDRSILESARAEREHPISDVDRLAFMTGLLKMAEDEAQPAETEAGLQSPFAAPLEQVVDLMAQMVSNEFKTQTYYVYYANMLRGLSHEGVAEEFMEHASHELEHANYLLRRMGVLSPGGVPIPAYPPPEPLTDPNEIVQEMIVVEQLGLALWKQLLSVMGENPMRYTIEEFLQREEEHQDELWQLVEAQPQPAVPQMQPPAEKKPAAPPAQTKVQVSVPQPQAQTTEPSKEAQVQVRAHIRRIAVGASRRKAASDNNFKKTATTLMTERVMALREEANAIAAKNQDFHEVVPQTPQQLQVVPAFGTKTVDNTAKPKDVSSKPSGAMSLVDKLDVHIKKAFGGMGPMPSPEEYVEQEEGARAQQAIAEAAHARTISMQSQQAAQQAQAENAATQQQLAELQGQVEQLQTEAQQNSVQALQSTQQAAEAESRAADHSISKMQLGMGINQMRQELANLVMRDPVAESAANVSDLAAQGMPATPQQQQQSDAAEQQALTGEAPQPGADQGGQQQVSGAPQQEQGQSGEEEAPADDTKKDDSKGGKPGTHISVKTAGIADAARASGHVVGEGVAQGIGHHIAEMAAKHKGELFAGGATLGAVGHLAHEKGREDRRQDVAEGVRRGMKTSSLADRRMAKAVFDGPSDTLGNSLRDVFKSKMPGAASAASKAKETAKKVDTSGTNPKLTELMDRARPHAPAFLGGMGVGILGTKAVSSDSRTPAGSGNFNDQYYSR